MKTIESLEQILKRAEGHPSLLSVPEIEALRDAIAILVLKMDVPF